MQTSLIDPPQEKSVPAGMRQRDQRNSTSATNQAQATSTLIEFPGKSRSVPEWRKKLSQRVREVQEQRAREAAEAEAATRAAESVSCALPSGQLELVPDREQTPMNPIVSKALQRVDRARRGDTQSTMFSAAATAPALLPVEEEVSEPQPAESAEEKPKLAIVAPVKPEESQPRSKPVRVISAQVEDSALSYLETCLSVPALACDTRYDVAGLGRRTIAGILDLLLVGLMVSPAAVAIEFSSGDWLNPRVMGLMAGITVATLFLYLTLTIALTGRTLSMRWFSMKTIDLRTGLIPTGGQAFKRAIGYVFSLAFFGLGLAYALIDPDRRPVHDRFSHTIVVRD